MSACFLSFLLILKRTGASPVSKRIKRIEKKKTFFNIRIYIEIRNI